MKKKILTLFLLIPFMGFGQLQSGDILIESNYGFVGGKGLWGAIAEEFGAEVSLTGPASLRFQYMTSDKFGIGMEANYTSRSTSGSFNYIDSITNLSEEFSAIVSQNVIRIMLRTSWEFVNNDNFQMHWANSIGYRMAPWDFEITSSNDESASLSDIVDVGDGWPLAFRTAIGIRYFINENIGLNMEVIGLSGGSLMNVGVSFKL